MNKNKILLAICTTTLLLTISVQLFAQQSSKTFVAENSKPSYGASLAQQSLTLSPTASQKMLALNDTSVIQQTKKETDWSATIATVVSILSLGVSSVVAYTSYFRQADIKLCFSRDLIFFPIFIDDVPTGSRTFKGVGFNLPLAFYNWSPQGGTIQRIRLVISKHNHDNLYDMAWTTFVKITDAGDFVNDNLAQPIPIKGCSSVNKVIRFDWIAEQGTTNSFDVQSVKYQLTIFGWTKNTEKPSLRYETSFNIEKEHSQKFEDSVKAKLSQAIWVSLEENEKPNQFMSRNNIKKLYLE
ncbi:MAG: hypothetical protein MUE44_33820 [Oscillatoriaceae cyanobacterium Prado104]|jgi:hypothetical protein|nr:hypothetical protein [Oscillatoriaceae cyanobacterium Prado104]